MRAAALVKVRSAIAQAAHLAGRDPSEVTLIAVTKTRPVGSVREALDAGVVHIGENRVQEAREKIALASEQPWSRAVVWHLIGHLQRNKARDAVRLFSLIHSLDSVALAQEIEKHAAALGKVQECLIEVKVSPEPSKEGLTPESLHQAVRDISRLAHVKLRGLMTVAPIVRDAEEARPYFRMLRTLRDEVNAAGIYPQPLTELSMGMTDDFPVAVEEGATMVRLGRALFEG
jgi:PLP dependent protein